MKTSTMCILSVPMLVAGAIALSGCGKSGNPTTISYREIGICKSFETAGTPQQAKADEGFAIFKIESVDNSKNRSAFYFDPVRFYVNQSTAETKGNIYNRNQRFMNADTRIGSALGVKYVDKITVPKGEKVDDVGYILIPLGLNNPSGGPEADKLNFDVTFDPGSGERGGFESVAEGINIVKINSADTKFSVVENCKDLSLETARFDDEPGKQTYRDQKQPTDRTLNIYYATNRVPDQSTIRINYTGDRAKTLSFGVMQVRVPDNHHSGNVEYDPNLINIKIERAYMADNFVVRGITSFERSKFVEFLHEDNRDTALVFVHGYHNSFDEGAFRLAQIVWDGQLWGLVPVLFSWPSKNDVTAHESPHF
jgi:hypothetical protein